MIRSAPVNFRITFKIKPLQQSRHFEGITGIRHDVFVQAHSFKEHLNLKLSYIYCIFEVETLNIDNIPTIIGRLWKTLAMRNEMMPFGVCNGLRPLRG